MSKIIECQVNDEYVLGSGVVIGAAGSYGAEMHLTFNETWDTLAIIATFKDALCKESTVVSVLRGNLVDGKDRTYAIKVPIEATRTPGRARLTLSGYSTAELVSDGNGGIRYQAAEENLMNTATAFFRVLESDSAVDEDTSVTPNLAAQVVDALNRTKDLLVEAEKKLDELSDDVDEAAEAENNRVIAEFGAVGNRLNEDGTAVVGEDGKTVVPNEKAGRVGAELERQIAEFGAVGNTWNGALGWVVNEKGEQVGLTEGGRVGNEASRCGAETERIKKERERIDNELARQDNEARRQRGLYYGDINVVPTAAECFITEDVEGGVAITGLADRVDTTTLTELVIPYEIDGEKVVAIGDSAFVCDTADKVAVSKPLKKIVLPSTVQTIGKLSFGGRSYVEEFAMSEGVIEIGQDAFTGCTKINRIDLPDTLTTLGPGAFYNTRFERVTLSEYVTVIGNAAFAENPNLVIYCRRGSFAETYAKNNGITYKYFDAGDVMDIIPKFKIKKKVIWENETFEIPPNSIAVAIPGSQCLQICNSNNDVICSETFGKLTLYIADNGDICYAGTTGGVLGLDNAVMGLIEGPGTGCYLKSSDNTMFKVMVTEHMA